MKDSTSITTKTAMTARLTSGDELTITPSGHSVTGTVTNAGIVWKNGTTGTSFPSTSTTVTTISTTGYPYLVGTGTILPIVYNDSTEEYFEPPHCGKCRTDVSITQSFIENDVLIMVFTCHGEKRRVDISLKRFKGNEEDAKAYLLEQIDTLFCEEAEWRELTPKKVLTPNADRNAIREWLTA